MSSSVRSVLALGLGFAALAVAGCATTTSTPVPTSGFLGDYSALEPHPDDPDVLVYKRRQGVLGDYDRVLLEPVLVYFHPEAKGGGVDPAELERLARALRRATAEELADGGYELTEEPGPGVLRIRAAITDAVPIDPLKNVGTKLAGAALGVGLLTPRLDLGRASIEAELLDGESGERIAAYVAGSRGRRYSNPIQGAKRWGDVEAAFAGWAELLRERLDATRGGGG